MNISPSDAITSEQLKQLLSPLSHDLKNSLTNIYLYAQIVDKKTSDDAERKNTQKIIKNIKRLDNQLTVVGELIKTYYNEYLFKEEQLKVTALVEHLAKALELPKIDTSTALDSVVTIDIHKMTRLLLVVLSMYRKETVTISLQNTENSVALGVTGDKLESPQLHESLINTYMQSVASQLVQSFSTKEPGFDIVFTLRTH